MHLGKDLSHWLLHDSDVNSTWTCPEINGLTEFWLKLQACANSVYQAFEHTNSITQWIR